MITEKNCLILDNFGVQVIIIKEYPEGKSNKEALMYARILIEEAECEIREEDKSLGE